MGVHLRECGDIRMARSYLTWTLGASDEAGLQCTRLNTQLARCDKFL